MSRYLWVGLILYLPVLMGLSALGFGNPAVLIVACVWGIDWLLFYGCLQRFFWFARGLGKVNSLVELEKLARSCPNKTILGHGRLWQENMVRQYYHALESVNDASDPSVGIAKHGHLLGHEHSAGLGHVLVMGAPGTGKTQLFRWLAHQAMAQGSSVIFIDPKGSPGLCESLRQASSRCGRPFYSLLPGRLEVSQSFNLLGHFSHSSELASRIIQLLPLIDQKSVFGQFAWMVLNRIIAVMMELGLPIQLTAIKRHVVDQGKNLQQMLRGRISDSGIEAGIRDIVNHDVVHYQKMILTLLSILDPLTTGALEQLLSPKKGVELCQISAICEQGGVFYAGLSAMTDANVAQSLGSLILSDLATIAGYRYDQQCRKPRVRILVDEASEMANPAFIQLLNKGRECGFEVVFAVQTLADLEMSMGSVAGARMMIGNANHLICFRMLDAATRQVIAERSGMVRVPTVGWSRSKQETIQTRRKGHGQGESHSQSWRDAWRIPEARLAALPDREFMALMGGSEVLMGYLPILA